MQGPYIRQKGVWRPQTAPSGPVMLDRTHPLAQGVVSFFAPSVSRQDLAQTGKVLAPITGIDGTSPMGFSAPPALQIQTGTVSYFGTLLAQPANDVGMVGVNLDASPYASYGLFFDSSIEAWAFQYGATTSFEYAASTINWYGPKTSVIASFTAGGNVTLYGDGKANYTTALATGAFKYTPSPIFIFGGDGRAVSAKNVAAIVHSTPLSPSMVEWLNAEPFAMLVPRTVRRYYAAASVIPAESSAISSASTPLPQALGSGSVSSSATAQAGTPVPGVLGASISSSTTATASASTPGPRALSTSTAQTAGSGAAATPVPRALVSAYSQTTATAQAGTPRPTAAAYSSLNTYGAGLAGTPVPGASGSGTGTSITGLVRASTPVPGALGSAGSTATGIGRAGTPLPGILALSTIPVQAILLASTPLPGATGFGLGYLVEENPAIGGTVSFAGSRRTISMAETSRSTSLTRAPRFVRFT